MAVPAIVLAAGSSRRLGYPKQLLEVDGETLVERAWRMAGEAGFDPVYVVLGAHHASIQSSLALHYSYCLINAFWSSGLASSVRVGVEHIVAKVPDATGVLLLVCDQPKLSTELLVRLRESFAEHEHLKTVTASYASSLGVPAVFPSAMFPALLKLEGDKGARSLLQDGVDVIPVEFDDGALDIDTPEDVASWRSSLNE